jgi:hypothetical protein
MVAPANPPFIQRVQVNDMDLTSIVCDKEEFDENIDTLKDVMMLNFEERAAQENLDLIKEKGHLPLCSRGTKTEHLFKKYNVETDLLAMIVRGTARKLIEEMTG